VARYIEQNPICARIVKKGEDFSCLSAMAHINSVRDKILGKDFLKKVREKTIENLSGQVFQKKKRIG
jgi:hypothetical protein